MKFYSIRILLICFVALFAVSSIGLPPKGYKIGDKIKDFSTKNINGKDFSLLAYLKEKKAKGVVIVFTCNTCPYAIASEDRLIAFQEKYAAKGYPMVAINPNEANPKYGDESFEKMQMRAKEKSFNFPYVTDPDQRLAVTFGATRTPEVFIAQLDKGDLVLRYMGAFDDSPIEAGSVKKRYAALATDELVAGKEVGRSSAKAIGCSIKFSKKGK